METGRGDTKCAEYNNITTLNFSSKNLSRSFSFNCVFPENANQEEVFSTCSVNVNKFLSRN
jgi:hypothetical protein